MGGHPSLPIVPVAVAVPIPVAVPVPVPNLRPLPPPRHPHLQPKPLSAGSCLLAALLASLSPSPSPLLFQPPVGSAWPEAAPQDQLRLQPSQ